MLTLALGANILWVNTYGTYLSYDLNGDYTGLRDTLTSNGHAIQSTTNHVDAMDLSPYDVVIVCLGSNWNGSFTASEAHALADFVRRGKGLLVMSENSGCPNSNLQAILDTFGFTAGGTDPGDVTMTNFTTSPPWANMFAGISAIRLDDPGAVTGPNWLVEYGGNYFGAAECFGSGPQGVAMIIGDINLWDNSTLNQNDNKAFLLNVVDFLQDAANQCGSLEVSEEPIPAKILKNRIILEPRVRAEVYLPNGRLLKTLRGPGEFALPRGLSIVRLKAKGEVWVIRALNKP